MKTKLFLMAFLSISCFTKAQIKEGAIELDKNSTLEYIAEPFEPESHTLDYWPDASGERFLYAIDGKPWYGSDMGSSLPRNQLIMLQLKTVRGMVELDVTGMFNVSFTGELSNTQFLLKEEGPYYMLYGFFSDGAGTYTAHWRIIKNTSIREVISNDETYFQWQNEK